MSSINYTLEAAEEIYAALGKRINELKKLEELEELKKLEEPKHQDQLSMPRRIGQVYVVTATNRVLGLLYNKTLEFQKSLGNVFLTRTSAEKEAAARKVIAELRACEGCRSFTVVRSNYSPAANIPSAVLEVTYFNPAPASILGCYFDTARECKEAICKVGNQRIYDAIVWLSSK